MAGSRTSPHEASERDELLATKVKIPLNRRDHLTRSRLIEGLDEGMARGVILVCAPAGFGKTTLLADWAATGRWAVAWLSLDPEDDDPIRFWRYVIVALDRAARGIGERLLPLLDPPGAISATGVVTSLVNVLEAKADELALVLDDYHAIASRAIHDDMAFFLSHLPAQVHVIIASRSEPFLPLARLRARGQLAELRAADLRFTAEEPAALLRNTWKLHVSSETLTALETQTEGWAVGLQLAALSLRGRPDPDALLDGFTGTHRFVLDYLSDEVLERQPDTVRTFLLHTSVLDRLNGVLCDAVSGNSGGQDMLEALDRANLFLAPLDDERRWYRFHHLFGDLLRARLVQSEPDIVPVLHRRAAAWYEKHELIDEAIRHALGSEDATWAARLVEQHFDEPLRRGEGKVLERWLSLLPDEVVRSRPVLWLAKAWILLHVGSHRAVERLIDQAERAFERTPELSEHNVPTAEGMVAEVPAAIALLRAELASWRGDTDGVRRFATSALSHIAEGEVGPRLWARMLVADADWMRGCLADAEREMAEVLEEGRAVHDAHPMMSSCFELGRVQRARGRLGRALRTYRDGLRFATEGGRFLPFHAGEAHLGIAQVLYARDEIDDALEHATAAIELTRQVVEFRLPAHGLVALAWIRQARGEVDAARDLMNEACEMYPGEDVLTLWYPAPTERARLLLLQGRVDEATRWSEGRGLMDTDEIPYPRERDYLVLCRVLLAQSEPDRAMRLLDLLDAAAEAQGRMGRAIEIRALRALGMQAAGDHHGALAVLAQALSLARPESHIRVFADEGPPMAALLQRLIRAGRGGVVSRAEGEYINRVARAFRVPARDAAMPGAVPLATGLIEPLTRRELEVLGSMAAGRRNQQIADELVVTLDTVKRHVSHIFDKLGAANRTEAVARARELQLIP